MTPTLEVRSISKRYGRVQALSEVSVSFASGEIHAVLGENGAGKSTLVGVLAGFVTPDSGELLLNGQSIQLGHPAESRRLGVQLVHQHFTLVPRFSGAENLALGNLQSLAGTLDIESLTRKAKVLADQLNWSLRLADPVSSYSVGEQQRLEILRALSLGGDVAVFDEPTAVLSAEETEDLLEVLRKLRDSGKMVILIAHKLSEVLAVADRVSVLRRGRKVATEVRANVNAELLSKWMVGDLPELAQPRSFHSVDVQGLLVSDLNVVGSRGEMAVRDASFAVKRGEILGIGGVDGNGQIELAEALAGIRPTHSGVITLGPAVVPEAQTLGNSAAPPRDCPDPLPTFRLPPAGSHPPTTPVAIAYIPQDRRRDGLAMGMSVIDNLLVTGHRYPEFSCGPFLRPKRIEAWADDLIERFQIKAQAPTEPVSGLSGGNGQKVVVARSLDRLPDLLVAVNPTRGLDIKATLYVHEKIRDAAGRGCAVVLISTDLDELAALSSRRAFISRGRLSQSDTTQALLGGEAP